MKLPDFLEFSPFNQLREQMGATESGDFTYFDGRTQLGRDELLSLSGAGLTIKADQLRVLTDRTLAYKNARVITGANQGQGASYHLAGCADLIAMVGKGADLQIYALLQDRLPDALSTALPCQACLGRAHYQRAGLGRQRQRQPLNDVGQEFSVAVWNRKYPPYPVCEKPELVF